MDIPSECIHCHSNHNTWQVHNGDILGCFYCGWAIDAWYLMNDEQQREALELAMLAEANRQIYQPEITRCLIPEERTEDLRKRTATHQARIEAEIRRECKRRSVATHKAKRNRIYYVTHKAELAKKQKIYMANNPEQQEKQRLRARKQRKLKREASLVQQ